VFSTTTPLVFLDSSGLGVSSVYSFPTGTSIDRFLAIDRSSDCRCCAMASRDRRSRSTSSPLNGGENSRDHGLLIVRPRPMPAENSTRRPAPRPQTPSPRSYLGSPEAPSRRAEPGVLRIA